ncbi:hypothetical protein Q0V21_19320 [Paenibacillus sp. 11B]|uniref:hypothetical protein n=1 Tax=Bacillales TaxID=1385 RepID=UPI00264C7ADE|nr:hypothetical protein [Paenibacillus sp. 11B]MDN8590912.1 hypothetical protein [Paenibacillus sp. 11B]
MWELVWFLLFSMIEMFGAFLFMMLLFRENPREYIWQAAVVAVIMGLQSYYLRGIDLGFVAVVINILFYVLLLAAVVKLPVIWSAIIACVGFFPYAFAQAALFEFFQGELLQLITSILFMTLAYILYRFGLGFEAPYHLLRFRWEKVLVVLVVLGSFALTAITMYQNSVWINIIFFGAASVLFLYYAIRKEREQTSD